METDEKQPARNLATLLRSCTCVVAVVAFLGGVGHYANRDLEHARTLWTMGVLLIGLNIYNLLERIYETLNAGRIPGDTVGDNGARPLPPQKRQR